MGVGFIGLGSLGRHMARNLARAGHDLIVYDVRRDQLAGFAELGVRLGASGREVATFSDVIQVCVLDDAQLERALLDADGVIAGASPGTIIAVHSTVLPSTIDKVAAVAAAQGVELVDAPVGGGEQGAIERNLSYMAGGTVAALNKCLPLFEASGDRITHTGGVGTAIKAKLAHQVIVCGNLLSAYEGMRMGLESGLSKDVLAKVVHDGFGQSRVADDWFTRSFGPDAVALWEKDLQLCLAFADELGLAMPGAALAQRLINEIVPGQRDPR